MRIDPEIFFSIFPSQALLEIGAYPESLKAILDLGDGRSLESQVYSVIISAKDRENPTLAITFPGAEPIGAKFLEDFGLKLDIESGELDPVRRRGYSYNYDR